MPTLREVAVAKIVGERERHVDLPGSETDMVKGPNDWVAIATRYLGEAALCNGSPPSREDFIDAMSKAGAVILGAMEHVDHMFPNDENG